MKKTLALVAFGAAIPALSASALADGPFSLKDTPVQVEVPSWTGFYFGVGAGYGHNHSKNNYHDNAGDPVTSNSSVNESADGGFISTMFGYDRQINDRFLVGAFVDVSTSEFTRGNEDIHDGLVIDRSWAIGGRLGYLVNDRTMIYANAGYTQAHFSNDGWWDIDANGVGPTLAGKGGNWFSGYFVGGGFERKLNDNFYLRGEARYSDFGSEVTNTGTFEGTHYVDREAPSIVTGELALVYKLDRPRFLGGNATPIDENHGPRTITYQGIDAAPDSVYYYGGTVFGLTNDLYHNGLLLRSEGVIADYNYRESQAPNSKIDVDDRSLDIMLGYQWIWDNWSAIGYVGYEVRNAHLSPDDPNSDVKGGADGFKVAAELESDDELPYYASLEGSYSTAFDSYYGQARIGWNKQTIVFGPEAAVYGDGADYAPRVGAFATIPFKMWWINVPAKITFDIGQQFAGNGDGDTRAGGEGVYGGSMLRLDF
ncbi:cellulose biosynthesis protein BcsS [Hyphomicrobium sp.]|uniref:cellulose biosynthesis protein BcsS n=1 Tax=Hyphomicrobium sp. TaxID=82 RepID=UPI003568E052